MPRVFLGSLALCSFALACGGPGSAEPIADPMAPPQAADVLTERIEALLDA